MSDPVLGDFCARLADRINEEVDAFQGRDLRADAGETGMVYIALRNAKGRDDLGEGLADRIAGIVEDELDALDEPIGFAISLGRGNRDLLLQVECRRTDGDYQR